MLPDRAGPQARPGRQGAVGDPAPSPGVDPRPRRARDRHQPAADPRPAGRGRRRRRRGLPGHQRGRRDHGLLGPLPATGGDRRARARARRAPDADDGRPLPVAAPAGGDDAPARGRAVRHALRARVHLGVLRRVAARRSQGRALADHGQARRAAQQDRGAARRAVREPDAAPPVPALAARDHRRARRARRARSQPAASARATPSRSSPGCCAASTPPSPTSSRSPNASVSASR